MATRPLLWGSLALCALMLSHNTLWADVVVARVSMTDGGAAADDGRWSELFEGTFLAGNGPGVVNGTNQGFGGTVEFELGGLTPGSGNDNHDQINDSATILFVSSPTLSISPWNSFVPAVGDQFTVMTWGTGLSGNFGTVAIDPFYASHGLSFSVGVSPGGGAGSLVLSVVAIPETPPLAPFALIAGGGWIASRIGRNFRRRF